MTNDHAAAAPALRLVRGGAHSRCQHHMLPFTGIAHVGYSAVHGLLRDDPRSRSEFFALAGVRS